MKYIYHNIRVLIKEQKYFWIKSWWYSKLNAFTSNPSLVTFPWPIEIMRISNCTMGSVPNLNKNGQQFGFILKEVTYRDTKQWLSIAKIDLGKCCPIFIIGKMLCLMIIYKYKNMEPHSFFWKKFTFIK